ncbi:MAG TPA: NAD(P)-binding domain-containing protein [Candidatus Dormibacteraeota bacterium]
MTNETIETVVIGGGQAGLVTGYHLKQLGRQFVILDANPRTGDAWRNRWDSLRLFSPARSSGLDGMRFPGPGASFPSKDQVADYLEAYAARFELPIRHDSLVTRLGRDAGGFVVETRDGAIRAANVVVAMATTQVPRIPTFARELDEDIRQLHSRDYRNPAQLQPGPALVVGMGNSGADIALELAASHTTSIAGKPVGVVPWPIEPWFSRHVLARLIVFLGHHVLSIRTPIGRRVRPKVLNHGAPLVRVKPGDLARAGVRRVSRIVGVRGGLPLTEDGDALEVRNVIWCTGFRPGFTWIDLPVLSDGGLPQHAAGVVPAEPGLYFVGLHFLYAFSSETLIGISRDAKRIARHIAATKPGRSVEPERELAAAAP